MKTFIFKCPVKGMISIKNKKNSENVQVVDEFVSSSEEIWRNVALHHFSNVSSAVNGCRQNESPNS